MKLNTPLTIGSVCVLLILAGVFFVSRSATVIAPSSEQKACTLEAKMCPDGSAVGRSGPNCEFTACPAYPNLTNNVTPEIKTQYIHAQEWPPKISLVKGTFSCAASGSEITQNGQTTLKTMSGKQYCVTTQSEGAAGTTYTTYTYVTAFGAQLMTVNFTLRFVQCLNYEEPNKSACVKERAAFDVDSLVEEVIGGTL